MSVTVDQHPLATEELGLQTVGQVIAHLQRDNRLVVNVLIDGAQPDLNALSVVKRAPLLGHTLFIETADPREMAVDVLTEVEDHLDDADRFKNEAADQLRANQPSRAMEKLHGCFNIWQHAQESILKTAQLLRLDLGDLRVAGRPLPDLFADFTAQLRQIKIALENRDFVLLTDVLTYETTETCSQWRAAIDVLKDLIRPTTIHDAAD